MRADLLIRRARLQSGLSLRELASRAATSHSAIAAYEAGSKCPSVATLDRLLEAAGFAPEVSLHRRHRGTASLPRGEELEAVLDLAAEFPARHSDRLEAPVFGYRR